MTSTLTRHVVLTTVVCAACDVTFAIPETLRRQRLADGQSFYCPNGHANVYRKSEADVLREQLASANRRADSAAARATAAADQRDAAERSNRALRGVVTRTRKRVGNGVCPCCNRSFSNLQRHMSGQHPAYAGQESPPDDVMS